MLYIIHCYTSYIVIRHTLLYVIHCHTSYIVIRHALLYAQMISYLVPSIAEGTSWRYRGNQLTFTRGWKTNKLSVASCKPTNMQDSYANYVIYNNTRIRQWYKYSGMVFNRYIIFQFNPRKLEILFFGVNLTIIKTDEYMHKSYYYEYGNKSWYFSKWTFRRESDIN